MTKSREIADRVVQDPRIMLGKPVIKGTRIPVSTVVAQLASNLKVDELFVAYPRLTIEDVKAALLFAHDAVEARSRREPASKPNSLVTEIRPELSQQFCVSCKRTGLHRR